MFEFVRTHNKLLQIVLGLLIFPSFVFFGVQGYSRFMGPDSAAVATVDGRDITKAEWDAAHRAQVDRVRQQNPNIDPKLLDSAEARRHSLDEIVRDRVMQAAVAHQELQVSDARLRDVLSRDEKFKEFLAQDRATQEAIAAQQGTNLQGLQERVRDSIAQGQVLNGVTGSTFVPAGEQARALDAVLQRREVQWQRYDTAAYLPKVQPTEADVKAYYDDKAHAALFRAPDEAQVDYVVLDLAALKTQVTPSEDDLKTYYEQNIKLFQAPEERHVSHIVVNVDAAAPAADKAKAKAKAEALLAEVRKNPASFADVARKSSDDAGSAPNGGDLDWLTKDALGAPIGPAVFAMKAGEISDLVEAPDGFHILLLQAVRGGAAKPYAEVRAQIDDSKRKELAQAAYASAAEQFTNMVYEQADSLQPVVDKLKLVKQTATVQRTPAPGAAGPLASQHLLDAVFSADSLRTKHNTEAIEAAPNQLVSARIVKFTPAHPVPLAEIHDKVLEMVRQSQAQAAARKDGEAKVAELKKDPAATLEKSGTYSRTAPAELQGAALDAAMKADVSKGPAVTGLALGDAGYIAMRVVKALPRDPADTATADQARQLIARSLGDAESKAYLKALETKYKVKIDEERVARALAQAGAASAAK